MPLDLTGEAFKLKPTSNKPVGIPNNKEKSPTVVSSFPVVAPKYKLDDLVLDENTRNEILNAISVFEYRDKLMNQWGLESRYKDRNNLSINLYGESGTGKTMASHAIADALNKKIIFVDYAEIESKYVGETSKNIKALFNQAQELDAVIIFDEADALLSRRVTDMRSSTDVSVNQTRSVLLNILNDYIGVVIFTTNFIQNFDPAFIRRIRYQIKFELPNETLRLLLWKYYVPDKMPTNVDFTLLSQKYDGISGSDISNAVFSAAVTAARSGSEIVEAKEFENAIERIIQAKKDNNPGPKESIIRRKVSEDYVKEQLGVSSLEG